MYVQPPRCFLNPETNFVWAFIVPVILIILANIGFFVMAASIMWKHKKRQKGEMKRKEVKTWLRASISLLVVLGVPWIFGVVMVEEEKLLPLAYIYTILVAFQGVWIFLIFVAFSKPVRGGCIKLCRSKIKESETLSSFFGNRNL